jgi:hypothetical protein
MTKRRDDPSETAVSRRSALKAGLTGTLVLGGIGGVTGATAAQSNGNGNGRGNENSGSDTLVVDDNGNADYEALEAAVDAADDGDTIEVRPGEYTGGVTLDQEDLTLTGKGNATVEGGGTPAIGVDAAGVTIERLQIENPGDRTGIGIGPNLSGVTVQDNEVSNVGSDEEGNRLGVNGIVAQAKQEDLEITDNELSELQAVGQTGQAIFLDSENGDLADARIADNEISDDESDDENGAIGVLLQASGATVEDNDISGLSGNFAQGVDLDTEGGNETVVRSNDIDDVSGGEFDGEAIKIDGGDDVSAFRVTANVLLAPVGIKNDTSEKVDAECNYWGDRSGPEDPDKNPDGEGSDVVGLVDYRPWKVGRGGGSGNCRGGT